MQPSKLQIQIKVLGMHPAYIASLNEAHIDGTIVWGRSEQEQEIVAF